MIKQSAYGTEPWRLVEKELDLDLLAQSESIFALSNGHIGLRGNLDEGDPHGLPGSYLNSVYEVRPLPYAEAGYGFPDDGQTVINVTNGKIIRLLVDDEPFDIRYGTLHSHERVLDLRAGTLTREVDWSSPAGARIKVTSVRMVSLTQRAIAAISYTVEPVDAKLRLVLQSEIVTNEELPRRGKDPRLSAVLENPLVSEESQCSNDGGPSRALLVHRTRASGLRIAAGMSHVVTGPAKMANRVESYPDLARFTVATEVAPGEQVQHRQVHRLRLVERAVQARPHRPGGRGARGRPPDRLGRPARRAAGLPGRVLGWRRRRAGRRRRDPAGGAVRTFPCASSGGSSRAEAHPGQGPDRDRATTATRSGTPRRSCCPCSPTPIRGPWPMPCAGGSRSCPRPRSTPKSLGLSGAAFPWRTIVGEEAPGPPAGRDRGVPRQRRHRRRRHPLRRRHRRRRVRAGIGLPLLVETARLWRTLGHHATRATSGSRGHRAGRYSAVEDNNLYTNLMAQQNLLRRRPGGQAAPTRPPSSGPVRGGRVLAGRGDGHVHPLRRTAGRAPAERGVHRPTSGGTSEHAEDHYPLLLHYPYFQLYRKQVVKQADLVLAMYMRPDVFTPEQKVRNFAYYEPLTVRDSSLSACTQAVIAAEVGQLDLAHDYLAEAALMDLRDVEHNTSDGVHMASLAGAWIALVAGFGGMRAGAGSLVFNPRLPGGIAELRFRLRYRGRKLRVTITPGHAMYELLDGEPLPWCTTARNSSWARRPWSGRSRGDRRPAARAAARPRPLQPRRHLIRRPLHPRPRSRGDRVPRRGLDHQAPTFPGCLSTFRPTSPVFHSRRCRSAGRPGSGDRRSRR